MVVAAARGDGDVGGTFVLAAGAEFVECDEGLVFYI